MNSIAGSIYQLGHFEHFHDERRAIKVIHQWVRRSMFSMTLTQKPLKLVLYRMPKKSGKNKWY